MSALGTLQCNGVARYTKKNYFCDNIDGIVP